MDLQAAETAHKRENKDQPKKAWVCPCTGCLKAVKQERERIIQEIENIDMEKLNALGMKILIKEIVSPPKKK
jgi:hypothetical protein